MKRIVKAFLVLMISLLFACAPAEETASNEEAVNPLELANPIAIVANGEAIDIGGYGHSAPFYADMDADNVPDLLVGEFKGGQIRLYKNHGTTEAPAFKDFEYLKAGGEFAVIPPS